MSLPTRHTPRRVPAVTLGMGEALAALALQRPFGGRVGFDRHSKPAELGNGTTFENSGPRATVTMK